MKKYQSIGQFKNVIHTLKSTHDYHGKDENDNNIYAHLSPYPVLDFKGTVKLHGTNASIVKYQDNQTLVYQSKERELSLLSDNSAFMFHLSTIDTNPLLENIIKKHNLLNYNAIGIYGEWCGGNIQKGIGLNSLPKMFVIFETKIWLEDGTIIIDRENETILDNVDINYIFNINQFPTYNITIDFNNPEVSQNELIEITMNVENECPVAKYFGITGIGEGVVWHNVEHDLMFKVKGKEHSVSKVKTLASIDTELVNSINELVDYVCTKNRMKQGLDYLTQEGLSYDNENIGAFLKWLTTDILKEEIDTIQKANITPKQLFPKVSQKAVLWYKNLTTNI